MPQRDPSRRVTARKLLAHWYVWPWFPLLGLPLFALVDGPIALAIYLVGSFVSIAEFLAWWQSEQWPLRAGPQTLVGLEAEVVTVDRDSASSGTVGTARVRGELWRIELAGPGPLRPHQRVRIVAVDGTTLHVQR